MQSVVVYYDMLYEIKWSILATWRPLPFMNHHDTLRQIDHGLVSCSLNPDWFLKSLYMWIGGFQNQIAVIFNSVLETLCCFNSVHTLVSSTELRESEHPLPVQLLSIDWKGWGSQDSNQSLTFLRAFTTTHPRCYPMTSVRADGNGIPSYFSLLLTVFTAISLAIFSTRSLMYKHSDILVSSLSAVCAV